MFYAIFTKNMGLGWPILHQSWVQIDFVDLENNLDDLQVNKTCLWHQEAAKIRQNAKKLSFEGSKSCFMLFLFRNIGHRWPILHQSWVQIGFVDLENNLDDMHVNESCLWHQKVAKIRHNVRKLSFEGSKLCFMLFFLEIWDLGGLYCTNLEYKSILLI